MEKYKVTGMSCAACSASVERAVRGVFGVTECSVNLLTSSMTVEGGDAAEIISAVRAAGYGAEIANKEKASDKIGSKNAADELAKEIHEPAESEKE